MITVLMTTYNAGKFLQWSVKSILNQTFREFELLIIDDGSTDNTKSVVTSFKDQRIRYIKSQHIGRSKSLNLGLNESRHDWILLADSDDILYPEKVEKYSAYSDHSSNIVFSWSYAFRRNHIIFSIPYPKSREELLNNLLLHAPNNAAMYNKNHILNLTGGYDETITSGEDHDLWLKVLPNSYPILLPEYYNLFNFRKDSISRSDLIKSQRRLYLITGKFIPKNKTSEINRIILWREYFYGYGRRYRSDFRSDFVKNLFYLRCLIAFLITFLPDGYRFKIINFNIKYRLRYLLTYLSPSSVKARKYLKIYVKS